MSPEVKWPDFLRLILCCVILSSKLRKHPISNGVLTSDLVELIKTLAGALFLIKRTNFANSKLCDDTINYLFIYWSYFKI